MGNLENLRARAWRACLERDVPNQCREASHLNKYTVQVLMTMCIRKRRFALRGEVT